jgi:hypothetical protein
METFSRETRTTDLDPWYVTGFVEAQGSFTFSRNGRQMALYFGMKLPEVDEPVLHAIRDFFGGIGSIYPVQAGASAYYRVCRREQLPVIVDHFDSFPLISCKRAAYEIWREMVLLKQRFRQPPRDELRQLAEQLSGASGRSH